VIPGAFHKQVTAACNALGSNLGAKHSADMITVDVREVMNMKPLSQGV